MTYIKTLWKDGVSLIDAEKMNKLEEGVRKNNEDISATNTKFDRRVDETNANLDNLSASTDRRFQEANNRMNVFDETLEGSFVSCNDTVEGILKNIVVLGQTYQNPTNLGDIKSSGVSNGDGTFTYKISSCGKNLFGKTLEDYLDGEKFGETKKVVFKLKPSTQYTCSTDCPKPSNTSMLFFNGGDSNVCGVWLGQSRTVTTDRNGNLFIAIRNTGYVDNTTLEDFFNGKYYIQLEEGTQATPKEEYKEDIVTITLPHQLRRYDELYYDKKEKAWCINKYSTRYDFTGAEEIIARQDILVSERSAFLIKNVGENVDKAIVNKFKYLNNNEDVEHFIETEDKRSMIVFVNKSSLDVNSVEGFRSWMVASKMYMYYPASKPKKIVLSKDIQVQLNQFFGTTNTWVNTGDVDAILRVTFNKSLGSAVQSNSKELEVIDERLMDLNEKHLETSRNISGISEELNAFKSDTETDIRGIKNKINTITETAEGSHITVNDTLDSYMQNIEIKGNTIQNPNNLADIKSVGDKVEGQELYRIPIVCTSKNIYGGTVVKNSTWMVNFEPTTVEGYNRSEMFTLLNTNEISISYNGVSLAGNIMWFDANKKFISQVFTKPFIPPSNAKYCSAHWSNDSFPFVGDKLQIEFGNKTTSFSEYQEHKLNILSPVQLEKVGDIQDRIIEKDGVWGVEKNIETYFYNSNVNITVTGVVDDFTKCYFVVQNHTGLIMSNLFKRLPYSDVTNNPIEGITYDGWGVYMSIENSKLTSSTKEGIVRFLIDNNMYYKVGLPNPKFIPLPNDQQVKLRTFANQTNISFLTEIEGTIKADVSKSLGATVNSNTQAIQDLNKDLERVKRLEEATTTTVTTESNFVTVEETSNGYFEDIKLEGGTLNNVLPNNKLRASNGTNFIINKPWNEFSNIKPNTKYYVKIFDPFGVVDSFWAHTLSVEQATTGTEGVITTKTDLSTATSYFHIYPNTKDPNAFTQEQVDKIQVVMIEGEKQEINQYFEGMKSVGDGVDEIVVSSVKSDGNLFDGEITDMMIATGSGELVGGGNDYISSKSYSVIPNTKDSYTINFTDSKGRARMDCVFFYDENKNYLGFKSETNTFTIPYENARYVRFRLLRSGDKIYTNEISNVILCKEKFFNGFKESKRDKKKVLYYDTETQAWKKPILREWDSIEKHSDGKYYYHKRSLETVFNGTETFIENDTGKGKVFVTTLQNKNLGSNYEVDIICDRYTAYSSDYLWCNDIKGISAGFNNQEIRIKDNAYTTVQDFKNSLTENNLKLVCELKQEEVYECTPIDLLTFGNETNYSINCGAISPKTTLKCVNYIGNVINTMKQKISLQENENNFMQAMLLDYEVRLSLLEGGVK